ncbi:MAG: TlpA family protein disulfide reductase, partial [Bacteroidales bacterium]|nr:TlpA family protein disulfide reductase [Bacteroidales bacterium]
DIKGNPVTLSQVIKKRTLIVFWASWCTYCDELLPEIKNWYDQLNSEDLTVVAISLDKSLTDWHKAVVKAGFEVFYNLSDLKEWDGEVTKMYNIYATPTMFLIDSDRRIIARPVTFFELTESMKL